MICCVWYCIIIVSEKIQVKSKKLILNSTFFNNLNCCTLAQYKYNDWFHWKERNRLIKYFVIICNWYNCFSTSTWLLHYFRWFNAKMKMFGCFQVLMKWMKLLLLGCSDSDLENSLCSVILRKSPATTWHSSPHPHTPKLEIIDQIQIRPNPTNSNRNSQAVSVWCGLIPICHF